MQIAYIILTAIIGERELLVNVSVDRYYANGPD